MSPLYWLIGSRFLGGLGYQIFILSGLYQIYKQTESAAMTGLTGLALFLPLTLVNLFAGQWMDRLVKKAQLYFFLQAAILVLSLALFLPVVKASGVFVLAVMMMYSLLRGLRTPLYYTLMKFSSQLEKNPPSQGRLAQLSTVSWQGPLILGPFLFSFCKSLEQGVNPMVFACLFFVGAAGFSLPLLGKHLEEVAPTLETPTAEPVSWTQIFTRHAVWLKASLADVLVMGSLSFVSLMPFLLIRIQEDPAQLGYLRSAISLGAFMCVGIFEIKTLQAHRQKLFLASLAMASVAVFCIPLSQSFFLMGVLSFVFGFCDGFSILYRDYLLFALPKNVLARASAVSQILNSGSEDLGEFRAGLMGSALGPAPALIVSAGIGASFTILYWALGLRKSSNTAMKLVAAAK